MTKPIYKLLFSHALNPAAHIEVAYLYLVFYSLFTGFITPKHIIPIKLPYRTCQWARQTQSQWYDKLFKSLNLAIHTSITPYKNHQQRNAFDNPFNINWMELAVTEGNRAA